MRGLRDLAFVDAAVERARERSAVMLLAMRRRRRKKRAIPTPVIEDFERRRSKLGRAIEKLQAQRLIRDWKRDRNARENCERLDSNALAAIAAVPNVEQRCTRFQKDVRIRELLASALRAIGNQFGRRDIVRRAEKLEEAGKKGFWGIREDNGQHVVRLRDRSGLIMLDPAESRERTAELIERLLPVLLECGKRKFEIHKAVFSEPNIPAGSLAFGKKHLFDRFMRVILERDASGEEIPRTLTVRHEGKTFEVANPARKFPEIVGAFAVQEDPLARDAHHWNTHLNVILVIDRGACAPLDRQLWPDDPEKPGQLKRDPAADVPGMFSWMKLSHFWGCQVEIRRLNTSPAALRNDLLEVIKYSCKTVSEKSLEKFEKSAPAQASASSESANPGCAPVPVLELTGNPCEIAEARSVAPAMIDWPPERVIEWIDANKGFRRVRGWGCLYKLGKLPRPTDPDAGIRWYGRLWISSQKITVQRNFEFERSMVGLIRENKSRSAGATLRPENPPRAGPPLH